MGRRVAGGLMRATFCAVLLGFFLVGAAAGQATPVTLRAEEPTVTSTGFAVQLSYTTPARDSLLVLKRRGAEPASVVVRYGKLASAGSYSRQVPIGKTLTGTYTFSVQRWSGGRVADSASVVVPIGVAAPAPLPPADPSGLLITYYGADTVRVAGAVKIARPTLPGDSLYSLCLFHTDTAGLWQPVEGCIDFTLQPKPAPVVVPPVAAAARIDSVRITTPALPDWARTATDSALATVDFYVDPHPAGATYSVIWQLDGVQVGTVSEITLTSSGASTRQVPRQVGQLRVCVARVDIPTPRVCSAPKPNLAPVATVGALPPERTPQLLIVIPKGPVQASADSTVQMCPVVVMQDGASYMPNAYKNRGGCASRFLAYLASGKVEGTVAQAQADTFGDGITWSSKPDDDGNPSNISPTGLLKVWAFAPPP